MHRKQVAENNSEKLIIILQYNKIFQNKTISTIASKYIEFSISQQLPLLKNDDVSNNWLK